MGQETKRVLIYRLGSLGDMIVALPSLHLIERSFPQAERRLLTNFPIAAKAAPAAAILGGSGLIHGYMRYAVNTRSLKILLALWWSIVRWRPDALVYVGPARGAKSARRDATFFRLCGISKQIGVPVTEEMQTNQPRAGKLLEPEAGRLARNLSELGDARIDKAEAWDLRLTEAEKARAVEVLKPAEGRKIVAFSIGTKLQANEWGRENWQALMERLGAAYPEHALALIGAPEESGPSEFVADGWRQAGAGPVINLCGLLTPRESAACLARAAVFLGHDSGPAHLAAAVGTTCVAVFSARNPPGMWFPHGQRHRIIYHEVNCMGCGLETCVAERKKCILSVNVDEVMKHARAVLG